MELFITISVIILCLAIEVFFSGSEIALVVADKMRLRTWSQEGNPGAKSAMWFIKHPAHFFSTVILGTNISVVVASTVATFYLIRNYGADAEVWALLLSPVILIFGEVLPKSLFQHYADRLAAKVSNILITSMYAMFPFVWILSRFTELLLGEVRHHVGSEPRITREELALLISSPNGFGGKASEQKMVSKVLELAKRRVENIMVPLAMVESIPVTATREGALQVFDLKGFSNLPIFENRAYNIIGILNSIDCLFAQENVQIKEMMKPVLYIPRGMRLHEIYLSLRNKGEQIAIVVDEYGAANGLITLEDILEEIVGDIQDEYEFGRQHWRILGERHFLLSGRTEIEEANEKLGLGIPFGDYETVAGFLVQLFGYIPRAGEAMQVGKWRYIVKQATERAIVEIEVTC